MGWNSWDCFGVSVTEAEVRANADFIADRLIRLGWEYIVVDLGWFSPSANVDNYKQFGLNQLIDPFGRLIPDPVKFPSSSDGSGFRNLADYVHGLGLKFGIHIMRGIPWQAIERDTPILGSLQTASSIANTHDQCPWYANMYGINMTRPGAQEYYDSIAELYASWHVDFIKADDLNSWDGDSLHSPYRTDEVEALRTALDRCGRPMVLSLSPGAAEVCNAKHLRRHANMWRLSFDFWDDWDALKKQFPRCAQWAPLATKGHWPDADMLPLGRVGIRGEVGDSRVTRLTPDEQRTMVTLWCIFRSPLMFGGHLPESDATALELISNEEVLAVNQNGANSRQVHFVPDQEVVWASDAPTTGDHNVALFNLSDSPRKVTADFKACQASACCKVRDLWRHKDLGLAEDELTVELPPHASALFKLESKS
jgi:hypothetical protein